MHFGRGGKGRLLSFVFFFFVVFLGTCPCYEEDPPLPEECGFSSPMQHAATKTPYVFVAPDMPKNKIVLDNNSCQPDQIWTLVRHGTRYPSKDGIRLITQRLPELAALIHDAAAVVCSDLIRELQDWRVDDVTENMAKNLHAEGELEMILLAERFQARLPGLLLTSDYHAEDFDFRATDTQRARESQFYFAAGLFGDMMGCFAHYFIRSARVAVDCSVCVCDWE